MHVFGAAGEVEDGLVGQRLFGVDALGVAGAGLPLELGAGEADEPVDGRLPGGAVLPLVGKGLDAGAESVSVGVAVLGDDGADPLVVVEGDAEPDG